MFLEIIQGTTEHIIFGEVIIMAVDTLVVFFILRQCVADVSRITASEVSRHLSPPTSPTYRGRGAVTRGAREKLLIKRKLFSYNEQKFVLTALSLAAQP